MHVYHHTGFNARFCSRSLSMLQNWQSETRDLNMIGRISLPWLLLTTYALPVGHYCRASHIFTVAQGTTLPPDLPAGDIKELYVPFGTQQIDDGRDHSETVPIVRAQNAMRLGNAPHLPSRDIVVPTGLTKACDDTNSQSILSRAKWRILQLCLSN